MTFCTQQLAMPEPAAGKGRNSSAVVTWLRPDWRRVRDCFGVALPVRVGLRSGFGWHESPRPSSACSAASPAQSQCFQEVQRQIIESPSHLGLDYAWQRQDKHNKVIERSSPGASLQPRRWSRRAGERRNISNIIVPTRYGAWRGVWAAAPGLGP